MRHILLTAICILLALPMRAQELPPVSAYEPETYRGGNQNWMLSQGEQQFIYVANNKGLLEFNGMQWTLHPSPNETIIRAVKAVGQRIYTGCYMEFGFWERDSTGQLYYQSLSTPVQEVMVPDEHFWNIVKYGQYLVFQSLDQLFLYDIQNDAIQVISPPLGVFKVFKTEQGLYFSDEAQQLYRLRQGETEPLLQSPQLAHRIIHLWEQPQGIFVQTAEAGRFRLQGQARELQPVPQPPALRGKSIYSALTLSDGKHAFGTISDGVYVLTANGQLQYHIAQVDGLANNTVLSLFEDTSRNLWAGTDNGISVADLSSPIRKYTDESGQLGTVYATRVHNGRLYLGTNQGLFAERPGQEAGFQLLPGTKGQVWSLFVYDGQLFCGHDSGTFLVDGLQLTQLSTGTGTWCFERVPGRPELLLQGNYDGLSVLQREQGRWQFRNKINGFDYSARFLALSGELQAYISHEYKGVFGLQLDAELREVTAFKAYEQPEKGKNAGLADFQGEVLYASRQGLYRLESFEEGFRRDSSWSALLAEASYESGKMTVDASQRLWLFTGSSILSFRQGLLPGEWQLQSIPIPAKLIKSMSGYENITRVAEQEYLIGTADGYLRLDLGELPANAHTLHLSTVSCRGVGEEERLLPVNGPVEIPFSANSLYAAFAVPVYSKYFVPHFQYRLLGRYEAWSSWSDESEISFKNLPYGDYALEIRSRVGHQLSANTVQYPFTVLRPWYWSRTAIAVYTMLLLALIYLTHRLYTRYYQRQESKLREENQQRLEAQQRDNELELIRVKNEQLQKDIDSKNRELAISTMSLVKKNELLHRIKSQLEASGDPQKNIRSVIRTIDKNTDEEETWNFFKEAFENADQEFFKKIQQRHPSLTHNDLKLCAYLRLNLSSKEIAPLLNISVRSVEVKRYRLRKKMELEHDEGLVEYIIGI